MLIIDVGNSNIVFGIWNQDKWIYDWRQNTSDWQNPKKLALKIAEELFENKISNDLLDIICISSVVPSANDVLRHLFVKHHSVAHIIVIEPQHFDNLKVKTNRPNEIGSDLVANALAAYEGFGGPAIVLDFGTALTFTAVEVDGQIAGVSICPGLKTATTALNSNTAQLPDVQIVKPEKYLGKNTIHAIQIGVVEGYVGLCQHLIAKISSSLSAVPKVVITGGFCHVLAKEFDNAHVDRYHTLNGIRLIAASVLH